VVGILRSVSVSLSRLSLGIAQASIADMLVTGHSRSSAALWPNHE
jgi:hypothetical protein